MDEEVTKWLEEENLVDLTEIFTSQKISSMKRLLDLNEELIKELIPQIGLRASFLNSWKRLIKNISIVQRKASKEISVIINNTPTFIKSVVDVPQKIVLSHSVKHTDLEQISKSVSNLDSIQANQKPLSNLNLDSNQANQESLSILNLDSNQECKRKQLKLKESIFKTGENPKQQSRHILSKSTEKLRASNFRILLKKDLKSNVALQNFKKKEMLGCADRSAIIEVVANTILQLNYCPTPSEYNIAATKLCELFPREKKETYYCPSYKCSTTKKYINASGKLVNKIKSIKKQMKKMTANSWTTASSDSSIVPSENQITHSVKFAGSCDPNDSEIKTAIACLKDDIILKFLPELWPVLLHSWSVTHPLRFKYLKETRPISQQEATSSTQQSDVLISNYFKNWNVLTLPKGYLLIQQDFKELYPERENGLTSKWDSIKEVLINLLRSEIAKSDEYGRKLLADLTVINTDRNDVTLFHLLPSLCYRRTKGASVAEARKAFILHVLIPGDLNRQIKAHNDWLTNRGLNFQPRLIFVGPTLSNITASYVQIDTIRYELRTPLEALDTCFKAFHALDVAYQEECQAVWLFIQKCFYNLYLKEDKNIPRVTKILGSLKGLISKKI